MQCKELVESLLGRYSVKDEKKYLKRLLTKTGHFEIEDVDYLQRKILDTIENITAKKFYVKELRKKTNTIESYLVFTRLEEFEASISRAPSTQRLKSILSALERGEALSQQQGTWLKDLLTYTISEMDRIKIAKIGKQTPINSQYAGMKYPMERLSPELVEKYPHGVWFDKEGFPVFTQYATRIVEVKVTGAKHYDFLRANVAAGLDRTPEGMTWHHHQDGMSMILMPLDIHDAIRHSGGVAFVTKKIKRIKGLLPAGTEWAGTTYPIENLPLSIQRKYPKSVKYKVNGHPNLNPYSEREVKIVSTGRRQLDFRLANGAAGISELPRGMTWYLKEDGETMQMVPRDLLKAIPNTTPW